MTIEELKDLGLTDEQMAGVEEFNKGLLENRDALLGENIKHKESVAEQARIAEEARHAAVKAEEERLKSVNDFEGFKAHNEKQRAEEVAAANQSAEDWRQKAEAKDNLIMQRDKSVILSEALNLIHDDYRAVSKADLSNLINISYNDNQEPVVSFIENGETVASTVEEFKSWAFEKDRYKNIMKGVNSSGAGTMKTGAASGKPMTLTEKAIAMNNNPNAQF